MSMDTAWRILESGTTSEAQLKRAELYLYLDRTKVLEDNKPKPKLEKVWVLSMRNDGTKGEWQGFESFGNEMQAHSRLNSFVNHPQAPEGTEFKLESVFFKS